MAKPAQFCTTSSRPLSNLHPFLKPMTPEQQRIAIAEACGFISFERYTRTGKKQPDGVRLYGTKDPDSVNYARNWELIPDYLNDLNAIREAELCKTLMERGYARYLECLAVACGTERIGALVFSTASQRAEAFLRAIGKWTS